MGRVLLTIGGVFAPLGLAFVALGGWFYFQDRSFAEGGVRTQGIVIDMVGSAGTDSGYTYKPVVEFRDAEGVRHVFTGTVGSSPPQHSTGETVDVLYSPGSPDEAILDSFLERNFLPLLFGGLGTVFAAIGGGMIFSWLRGRGIAAQLRASGLPIQAKFVECHLDTRVRVNGRSPYRVVCQATHPATGKLERFTSEAIWVDLRDRLAGKELRVFVDPARPARHLVDLSPYVGESAMS